MSLYQKYRPRRFRDVLGQEEAVAILTEKLKTGFPEALLLSGPSGVGKTTIARILAVKLGCKLGCADPDYFELDCPGTADITDRMRSLKMQAKASPAASPFRVWYFDEVQSLSRTPQGMQSMLKMLEDVPKRCRYILSTTDPEKLLPAIRTRCLKLVLRSLKPEHIKEMLLDVIAKEKASATDDEVDKIAEYCEGSAREALMMLEKVLALTDPQQRLDCIQRTGTIKDAFDIVRILLWAKPDRKRLAELIAALDDGTEWEQLRRLIFVNASNTYLKSGFKDPRAFAVLDAFVEDWMASGTGKSGRACLTRCCGAVLQGI